MLINAAGTARRRALGLALSCLALLLTLLPVGALIPLAEANGVPFSQDDVFTDIGNGQVNHFSNTGTLRDVLNDGTGSTYTTGDCFDASNNLYVTNIYSNSISKFDANGNLVASVWATTPDAAESCVFDASGNMYVGGPFHATIYKYSPSGTLLKTYSVAGGQGTGGTDWVDLAADQCTMLYDGEGTIIKSFNLCTNTQNPDFASGLPGNCFALRIRPTGDVLVACSGEVVRLSSAGAVVQTYPVGNGSLFALNLDPDGTSFWTADDRTNNVFHVRISDGTVLGSFNGQPGGGNGVYGLAVYGEITVAKDTTPPACALTAVLAGPPKQLQITVQDSDGGLAASPNGIVVTSATNATVSIPAYAAGDTNPVVVTATKVDQGLGASVALSVADVAGNITNCDPVSVSAIRADGQPVTQQVAGVQKADTKLTVVNDGDAVDNLSVSVNGHTFKVDGLKAGAKATVDVSSALTAGTNNVSATLAGKPGSSATLLFGNI